MGEKQGKRTPRDERLRKNTIVSLIILGIGLLLAGIGAILLKYIIGWILLIVGAIIAICALAVGLGAVRSKIKTISCPRCGRFFDYPRDVRIKYLGSNTTVNRDSYGSTTSRIEGRYLLTAYCPNCPGYSKNIYKTISLAEDENPNDVMVRFIHYFRH